MFDANMKYLPKGKKFFTKVNYCSDCTLYDVGVRTGDILVAEMLSDCNINPEVKLHFPNGTFTTTAKTEFEESLLVYEGNLDGTGFIDAASKKKVQHIIDNHDKEKY